MLRPTTPDFWRLSSSSLFLRSRWLALGGLGGRRRLPVGNVVHNRVQTTTYAGDFYFGYSDRMSTYWQTSADNIGGHGFLTSSDGKTYTGTSSMGPMSMQEALRHLAR